MRITLGEKENRLVIGLSGRFDAGGAAAVSEALEKALNIGRRFVELDMSGVDYLSSAGIRVLLHHCQKMEKLKGSLSLTGVQERVERILEMAGLYDLLRPAAFSATDPRHPPAATLDLPGWRAHDFALDSSGALISELIGEPCDGTVGGSDRPGVVVPFPVSTIAVGMGRWGMTIRSAGTGSGRLSQQAGSRHSGPLLPGRRRTTSFMRKTMSPPCASSAGCR